MYVAMGLPDTMLRKRRRLVASLLGVIVLELGCIVVMSVLFGRGRPVCLCPVEDLEAYLRARDFNNTRIEMTRLPGDHVAPDMRKVYTYFQNSSYGSIKMRGIRRLLKLWLRAWHQAGYDPIILTSANASSHPQYHPLREAFERFPTVNNLDYEVACYLRWLAFRMAGGGTFMDYDILPFGHIVFPSTIDVESLVACRLHAPMLTHAGPLGVERQIALMANFKGPFLTLHDCPHISDMHIMRAHADAYTHYTEDCLRVFHFSHFQYDKFQRGAWTRDEEGREGFAADCHLMMLLVRKRVWVILPSSIQLVGKRSLFGLGLEARRVRRLLRHLRRDDAFADEMGRVDLWKSIGMSDSDIVSRMVVAVVQDWPATLEEDDVVFVVFEKGQLQSLKPSTRGMIEENLPRVVPLLASSEHCQLVIDYNLGNAAKEKVLFAYAPTFDDYSALETRLKQRFDELVSDYAIIEQQVDRM